MAFNQNYYGYQNPVVSNIQPRLQQMDQLYPQLNQQQFYGQQQVQQPQIPQSGINGRIVDDVNSVSINEVSSDNNNPSVFLKNDLSEMYLKRYSPNGLIQTFTYKLQMNDDNKNKDGIDDKTWGNEFEFLQEQLNIIDEKLNKVLSSDESKSSRSKVTSNKKEVTE